MHLVLRRIAIHGALTALVLGLVGIGLAELASIWLTGSAGPRVASGEAVAVSAGSDDALMSSVRTRIPLFMAAWGFGVVALGECLLHLRRSRKPAPPSQPQPDDAEKLLEELLAQSESKRTESGDGGQETGDRRQESESPRAAL